MFLQMALHSCMCQIYPLTHIFLLRMMVYLLELQLSMWFAPEPFVGEMANVMDTTHLGFFFGNIYLSF
jgi:hypothetical protein